MARKMGNEKVRVKPIAESAPAKKSFRLEFKNTAQKIAYVAFEQHDFLFLIGPAGTAKTFLATAFAVSEILNKKKKKIVLSRPIVEAGEKIGFLPGTAEEKIHPYLMPIFDCLDMTVGSDTIERNKITQCMEIVPLAHQRGRTFSNAIVILDEAQNATEEQLKLAMTRIGEGSKMIITGDPNQSDLKGDVALPRVVEAMKSVQGISVVEFNESHIVRHALVADILRAWPAK